MSPARIHLDDLAFFLAVAEAGTLAAASRAVGVDASTVSRRVARLEEDLGLTLFTRTGPKMVPSEAGERLAERARAAMNLVEVGLDEITRGGDALEGVVRLAAPTEVGAVFVVPSLPAFLDKHPGVEVVLLLGSRTLELGRREADLAVRTVRPTRGDVVARRLGAGLIAAFRAPDLDPALARRRWLTWEEDDPLVARALAADPQARVILRSNDMAGLRAACVAGLGAAWLPVSFGRAFSLVPVEGIDPVPGPPVWLAAPRTSLELPRVRALWDHLEAGFERFVPR